MAGGGEPARRRGGLAMRHAPRKRRRNDQAIVRQTLGAKANELDTQTPSSRGRRRKRHKQRTRGECHAELKKGLIGRR